MPSIQDRRGDSSSQSSRSASEKLGTIPAGTVFIGEQVGNFIKTKISTISIGEGFVRFGGASSEMPEPNP